MWGRSGRTGGSLWACEGRGVGLQSGLGGREAPQNRLGVEGGPRAHCPDRGKACCHLGFLFQHLST